MLNEVICDWCHREFERDTRHIYEAEKFGWKQFCSQHCLSKSRCTGKELICENPDCKRKFYRPLAEYNKSKKHFCSGSCATVVNNKARSVNKRTKKCANPVCDNLILSARTYCSRDCFRRCVNLVPPLNKIDAKIYRERVVKAIRVFVQKNNRVPLKIEMQNFYRPAQIAFGTWNKAIAAAGFKPNQLKFTHKYIANDKDICDSLAEKIIDDWLSARKIQHLRNFPYPGNNKFTVDFKIDHYWIEFFGLNGQLKRYDQLKKEKLKLIKKYKLNLVEIFPHHLFPQNKLNQLLNFLLAN